MLRGTSAKSVFEVVKWLKEYRAVTEVLVKIEMPGVDKNSLEVRVEDDVLKVDGKLDFSKYRSLQPLYTESLGVRRAKARCMTCASLRMNWRRRRFASSHQLRHQTSVSHGSDSEPSVNPRDPSPASEAANCAQKQHSSGGLEGCQPVVPQVTAGSSMATNSTKHLISGELCRFGGVMTLMHEPPIRHSGKTGMS
jgi:hypothetical protein